MRVYLLDEWAGMHKNDNSSHISPEQRHNREVVWDVVVHGPAQQVEGQSWISRTSWRRTKIERAP